MGWPENRIIYQYWTNIYHESNIIPRSHSYCLSLSLCLEWYNGLITTTARDRVISVLNHWLEWDKFVRLTLTYSTPDSGLTYTYFDAMEIKLYQYRLGSRWAVYNADTVYAIRYWRGLGFKNYALVFMPQPSVIGVSESLFLCCPCVRACVHPEVWLQDNLRTNRRNFTKLWLMMMYFRRKMNWDDEEQPHKIHGTVPCQTAGRAT